MLLKPVAILALFIASLSQGQPRPIHFFNETGQEISANFRAGNDATIIRSKTVSINTDLINSFESSYHRSENGYTHDPIVLDLFDGISLYAHMELPRRTMDGQSVTWVGNIENMQYGQIVIVTTNDVVSCHITTDNGSLYQVRYAGEGRHYLSEVDQSKFSPVSAIPVY